MIAGQFNRIIWHWFCSVVVVIRVGDGVAVAVVFAQRRGSSSFDIPCYCQVGIETTIFRPKCFCRQYRIPLESRGVCETQSCVLDLPRFDCLWIDAGSKLKCEHPTD